MSCFLLLWRCPICRYFLIGNSLWFRFCNLICCYGDGLVAVLIDLWAIGPTLAMDSRFSQRFTGRLVCRQWRRLKRQRRSTTELSRYLKLYKVVINQGPCPLWWGNWWWFLPKPKVFYTFSRVPECSMVPYMITNLPKNKCTALHSLAQPCTGLHSLEGLGFWNEGLEP